jgi:hypothetical protein
MLKVLIMQSSPASSFLFTLDPNTLLTSYRVLTLLRDHVPHPYNTTETVVQYILIFTNLSDRREGFDDSELNDVTFSNWILSIA